MDEIVLRPLCDLCETRTPAVRRVVIGVAAVPVEAGTETGPLPRPDLTVVDLCPDHLDRATDAGTLASHGRALSRRMTRPTLTAAGNRVGRKPGPRGGVSHAPGACPVCGVALWGSRSLVRHLQAVHRFKPPRMPKECPDCGYKTSGGVDPARSMKRHRNMVHGWTQAAAMVEANQ